MPKYLVGVSFTLERSVVVEADSEQEAEEKMLTIDCDLFTDLGAHDLRVGHDVLLMPEHNDGHGRGSAYVIEQIGAERGGKCPTCGSTDGEDQLHLNGDCRRLEL
jgi:hypothetical protein